MVEIHPKSSGEIATHDQCGHRSPPSSDPGFFITLMVKFLLFTQFDKSPDLHIYPHAHMTISHRQNSAQGSASIALRRTSKLCLFT